MKRFSDRLGLKKMDEMEMAINLNSLRWAWMYTVLFLFIWTAYELLRVKTPESPYIGLPLILLTSQNIVRFIATSVYNKKITGTADEE